MSSELKDRILEDVKTAMRARDKVRLGTLRLVTAAIKQREVDERIELDDGGVIEILTRLVKQRQDSITQYTDAGRDDLAAVEKAEVEIIREFLPEQLSGQAIAEAVAIAITSTGAASMKDMGKVMGVLRPQLQGRADMGAVSAAVKKALAGG